MNCLTDEKIISKIFSSSLHSIIRTNKLFNNEDSSNNPIKTQVKNEVFKFAKPEETLYVEYKF